MRKIFKVCLTFLVLFATLLGGSHQPVVAQTSNTTICIMGEPNVSSFPQVSVNFHIYDSNYQVPSSLNESNITVLENNESYTPTKLTFNEKGTGLDLYFIIDQGYHTDVESSRAMIVRFLDRYGVDGLDQVTILGRNSSTYTIAKTSTNFDSVKKDLIKSSLTKTTSYVDVLSAIEFAANQIGGKNNPCGRQGAIVVFTSGNRWTSQDSIQKSVENIATISNSPIHFMHLGNTSSDTFSDIANKTKGQYIRVGKTLTYDSGDLDQNIFKSLRAMRGSYTLTYRSTNGTSGTRDLAVTQKGAPVSYDTQRAKYTVNLQPPKVTILNPVEGSDVLRTATVYSEPKFLYDQDVVPIEFKIEWPDGYRRTPSKIRIIGTTPTGEITIQEIAETELTRDTYNLSWNVDDLTSEGTNPLGIRVEIIDELNLQSITTPSNFTVTNHIPESVAKETVKVIEVISGDLKTTQLMVYILAGILGLIILLSIIFRKRIKQAFSATGKIGMAIETVRKTLIGGGGRRKNPIAKLEVISPTNEVKSIFTESVKLGRDPNISDYTFYSINSECSVSGEHAHLVKKRDGWKIIATSHSNSPVFVDGQRINMHQEYPIVNGQTIELGYQDLGSAVFRFVEVGSNETFQFAPPSEFKPETEIQFDNGYRRTQVNMPAGESMNFDMPPMQNEPFSPQEIFGQSSNADDDFDALFNNLRDS